MRYSIREKTENHIWGQLRWKADPEGLPKIGTPAENELALDTLLGIPDNYGTSNALADGWQLLPWSWMADWAGNIGDFLDAKRNHLDASLESLFIMQKTLASRTFTLLTPGIKADQIVVEVTTKQRRNTRPTLSASIPFLDGRRMSILSGLVLARSPSRKGGRI